jgi:hypothetical protein
VGGAHTLRHDLRSSARRPRAGSGWEAQVRQVSVCGGDSARGRTPYGEGRRRDHRTDALHSARTPSRCAVCVLTAKRGSLDWRTVVVCFGDSLSVLVHAAATSTHKPLSCSRRQSESQTPASYGCKRNGGAGARSVESHNASSLCSTTRCECHRSRFSLRAVHSGRACHCQRCRRSKGRTHAVVTLSPPPLSVLSCCPPRPLFRCCSVHTC